MTRSIRLPLVSITAFLVVGCSVLASPPHPPAQRDALQPKSVGDEAVHGGRMLREKADLAVEVEELAPSARRAEDIVERAGGHVSSSFSGVGSSGVGSSGVGGSGVGRRSGSSGRVDLTFRVPATRLDTVLDDLAELGEATHRHRTAEDVSEALIDLQARHDNLIALRDRLRLLLERATKVDEILKVEMELTRVQTELDALTGRLTRLRGEVALAALDLALVERQPKRILGPLGLAYYGTAWLIEKLFVIRDGST